MRIYFYLNLLSFLRSRKCQLLSSKVPRSVRRPFLVPMVVLSAVSASDKGNLLFDFFIKK